MYESCIYFYLYFCTVLISILFLHCVEQEGMSCSPQTAFHLQTSFFPHNFLIIVIIMVKVHMIMLEMIIWWCWWRWWWLSRCGRVWWIIQYVSNGKRSLCQEHTTFLRHQHGDDNAHDDDGHDGYDDDINACVCWWWWWLCMWMGTLSPFLGRLASLPLSMDQTSVWLQCSKQQSSDGGHDTLQIPPFKCFSIKVQMSLP